MRIREAGKYRSAWLGAAILWVILSHMKLSLPWAHLAGIFEMGYGGVDVFIFASGFGLYLSLEKNADMLAFYKRRFLKIMPAYWCFLPFWFLYRLFTGGIPFSAVIGNIFCIQFFTGNGNEFNWYLSLIWFLYLAAPLAKVWADKVNKKTAALTLLLLIVMTWSYWEAYYRMFTVTRWPVFFVGMLVGRLYKQDVTIKKSWIAVIDAATLLLASGLLYLVEHYYWAAWKYGLLHIPFILIAPGLCFILSQILFALPKAISKIGNAVLGFLGKYSLELFLVHCFVFEVFNDYLVPRGLMADTNRSWIILLIPVALLTAALVLLTRGIRFCFQKCFHAGRNQADKQA